MSFLFNTHNRSPLCFTHGEGVYLFDKNKNKYLDYAAGIAVNSLGHCNQQVNNALVKQANRLWHVSNLYTIDEAEEFAQKMCEKTFADKVFFCNSGAEAVECVIKSIRRYFYVNSKPHKNRIITFKNSFHGRTIATLCASANAKYMEGFAPHLEGFDSIECGDIELVKKTITQQTAGIIIEPVQGEGGVNFVGIKFLEDLRKLCNENDILLAFDEVQCGMGRTGKLFAYQHTSIEPDLIAFAKGIANGFPLGGCLATNKAASGITIGTHGTTYGSNPLAMAVGMEVFDTISQEAFLQEVSNQATYLNARMQLITDSYPEFFTSIKGLGLMRGFECTDALKPQDFVAKARENNLLLATAGSNVIRLLPPLIITKDNSDEFAEKFVKTLAFFKGASPYTP